MPLQRKTRRILVLAVVLAGAYYAYKTFMPQGGWGPGGAPPVSVAEVVSRKIRQWQEFSGRLVAVNQVEVRPRVSGVIDKVHFEDGAMVKKGDVLFTIDPRPFETVYRSASARASLAESELKRAQKLMSANAIPQNEFDRKKNDAEVARAELARARLDLDYTEVKSPIDGRVSRAEITEGNLVESGGSAPVLTTVVTSTPIYADFEIDEASFLKYAQAGVTGQKDVSSIPVTMTMSGSGGDNGIVHQGHIESFDNRLNTTSGTIRVRAVFDNPEGVLVPGLFARIKLGGPTEADAVLITERAVGTDQSKKYVYVVGDDNKLAYREVKLGIMADDGLRAVTEGLKPGEKILVSGITPLIRPGIPVTPEVVPMNAPPASASNKGAPKETPKEASTEQKQGAS